MKTKQAAPWGSLSEVRTGMPQYYRPARLELAETAVLRQTSAKPSPGGQRLPERSTCLLSEPEALPAGGLFGHNEKAKEALNKLSRTFLLASFRNRPPWHCLPGPRLRIFSMPFLVIYWLINSSNENLIWVNLSQIKKHAPKSIPRYSKGINKLKNL